MEDNVLWLYVSMDDPVGVEFVNGLADLPHHVSDILFWHALMFFELFEELASSSYFQNDVDFEGIIEEAEHSDDVGVVEEHLYFELSDELFGDFLFHQ